MTIPHHAHLAKYFLRQLWIMHPFVRLVLPENRPGIYISQNFDGQM